MFAKKIFNEVFECCWIRFFISRFLAMLFIKSWIKAPVFGLDLGSWFKLGLFIKVPSKPYMYLAFSLWLLCCDMNEAVIAGLSPCQWLASPPISLSRPILLRLSVLLSQAPVSHHQPHLLTQDRHKLKSAPRRFSWKEGASSEKEVKKGIQHISIFTLF